MSHRGMSHPRNESPRVVMRQGDASEFARNGAVSKSVDHRVARFLDLALPTFDGSRNESRNESPRVVMRQRVVHPSSLGMVLFRNRSITE